MNKAAKFWDSWAQRYAKKAIADEPAYQHKLKKTQEFFTPDTSVLEFGCGTGSTALIHAQFVKSIRALDISPKMVEIAKNKAISDTVSNVNFEINTLKSLVIDDESIDVILGLSVLHLLADWRTAITKAHRILKPGGVFVSSTPCLSHLLWLRAIAPIGKVFGVMPNLYFFSDRELKQTLVEAGFSIEYSWQPKKNAGVFIVARKGA